jgi:D-alanine-D-alanine ligase
MKITVLLGGTSSERDVSVISGLRIADALRSRGHEVVAFDTAKGEVSADEAARLLAGGVGTAPPSPEALRAMQDKVLLGNLAQLKSNDVVFLALHGGQGEDGTIQALLELVGVPYTGSGHLASGIAMDKDLTKRLLRQAGVPTAEWRMAPLSRQAAERVFQLPVVVKPSKQGSTVGLTVVKHWDDYDAAVAEAYRHDDEVMIEAFIPGRELTVAVIGDVALPVGEIIPAKEIYDYECKYTPGMAREEFPADLPPAIAAEAQRLGLATFQALKLRGYARVDFRLTPAGDLFCLEANTLPGMTALSLVPQAAAAAGIGFEELCDRVAHLAAGRSTVSGDAR